MGIRPPFNVDDVLNRARMEELTGVPLEELLAAAWEQGCEAGMAMAGESFWRPENPYRAD